MDKPDIYSDGERPERCANCGHVRTTVFRSIYGTERIEYDRMVEHLKSACATCVYGFPVAIGHSCGITKKVTSAVIVKCEAYKRASWAEVSE